LCYGQNCYDSVIGREKCIGFHVYCLKKALRILWIRFAKPYAVMLNADNLYMFS